MNNLLLLDSDGDGEEVALGTDPNDPASNFSITSIIFNPNGSIQLTWPSKAGNQYAIQQSNTLKTGSSITVQNITAISAITSKKAI